MACARSSRRPTTWSSSRCPGSFEVPFGAKVLAGSGQVDAVITLGCVIRGETAHFDLVAGECARGVQDAQLATGVPIAFGVLATEDLDAGAGAQRGTGWPQRRRGVGGRGRRDGARPRALHP